MGGGWRHTLLQCLLLDLSVVEQFECGASYERTSGTSDNGH